MENSNLKRMYFLFFGNVIQFFKQYELDPLDVRLNMSKGSQTFGTECIMLIKHKHRKKLFVSTFLIFSGYY